MEVERLRTLGEHFFGDHDFPVGNDPFSHEWIGINFPQKQIGCLDCSRLYNVSPWTFGTKKFNEAYILGIIKYFVKINVDAEKGTCQLMF